MKNSGAVLLILVIAILVVGLAGAAFFFSGASPGAGTSAVARPAPTFSVALARTSTGLTTTLTVANKGSAELRDLRILRADIASQAGGKTMPIKIGTLSPGVAIVVTLPYSGPAPAANAPVQLQLQYDYKTGLFTNGGGSQSITTILP